MKPTEPFQRLATSRRDQRGQAMVELAIMASLTLVVMTFLVQLGLQVNYAQEIEQQTFRRALRMAQREGEDDESPSITLYQLRHREVPSLTDAFLTRPPVQTQASSTVTWAEHLTLLELDRSSQSRLVVRLDENDAQGTGQEAEYRGEDLRKYLKGTNTECTAYYFPCARGCDTGDTECPKACRRRERDLCEDAPLVQNMASRFESHGEIGQDQDGSHAIADATLDTTVTLDTRAQNELRSTRQLERAYHW